MSDPEDVRNVMLLAIRENECAELRGTVERLTRERDEWKAKANESATVRRLETMLLDSMSAWHTAHERAEVAEAEAKTLRERLEQAEGMLRRAESWTRSANEDDVMSAINAYFEEGKRDE